ncbi:MAG TPA: hypothetical protein VEJ36_08115 [Nitrososphaerales archaeon]|nr:hypothetical protein [Nitrososphaerales archaeon]
MDPLVLLEQAEARGSIPKPLAKKVKGKMAVLVGAVERVERASGLRYPPYYVEPTLPYSSSVAEYGQMGLLFARVVPATTTGRVTILVQFTAALLLYGAKGTVEAVAAHEFTHYVDLVRRLSRTNVTSDERSSTLYESSFSDAERTVPPKLLFSDRALVSLVSRKFKVGLEDKKLNERVGAKWVAKNLPMRTVPPEENVVRLSMAAVLSTKFDPEVVAKAAEIERKMRS